jgi:hypothetical protein
MKRVFWLAVAVCLFLAAGCAKSVTQSTDNGKFRIRMVFSDDTLKLGRNEVTLKVTDEKGADVEGAKVVVVPTMPEHHMGAMFPPTVTEEGGGSYRVVMPLMMGGHWVVKVRITKGADEGSATFDFPNVGK